MNSIYRSLAAGASAAVLALTGSLLWSSPLSALPTPATVIQDTAKSQVFSGTIVKAGDSYVLRDSSGATYALDDASKAQPFEGKAVKVTGKLDASSKTIHVESIEGAS